MIVRVDSKADREILEFPKPVIDRIYGLIIKIGEKGYLSEPEAKKLKGKHGLFELRIRLMGQWRVVYVYYKN